MKRRRRATAEREAVVGSSAPHFGRRRPTEEIALCHLAPQRAQHGELLDGLDAFGHSAQAQRVGEGYRGGADRTVLGVAPEPVDERSVGLQRFDREALQIGH